jgi:hypothetical protein
MWESLIPVAGAVLGGIAGSGGGNDVTTTGSSAPWAGQQPYLTDLFGQAQDQYQRTSGYGPFAGAGYAAMNPMQRAALEGQFAQGGQAAQGAQNIYGMADRYAGAGAGAGDLYTQAGDVAGAGPGGIYSGLQSQFGQGMKDAAGRDIARNLYENQIPGQNLDAAAAGASRGSRAGAAEAVLKRGAADRLADISSQVDVGLMGQAGQQWGQQMAGLRGAGQGLAGLGQQAAGMYGSGFGLGQQGLQSQFGAGAGFQADQQAQLDAQRQRHQDYTMGSWGPLQQYGGLVQGNYGGQTTTTQQGPGALQSGLGTGMALYSMFNQ